METKKIEKIQKIKKDEYGDIYEQFEKIANIVNIRIKDVYLTLVFMKLLRETHKNKEDNIIDALSYLNYYHTHQYEKQKQKQEQEQEQEIQSLDTFFKFIKEWATYRGLIENGNEKTQILKLIEEVGELSAAIIKEKSDDEIRDAIGDILVVVFNLINIRKDNIYNIINNVWKNIKNRKGKMIDGNFVKYEK
jgi:NTP pyrophosphatase (non-canonical NTP hydrolase)